MEHILMDHAEIERDDIVEGYVTGRLAPGQVARFEEHYLDCAECIDAVETAERLRRGLEEVASRETALAIGRTSILAALAARLARPSGALAAGFLLVLALLPAGLAWRQAEHRADRLASELAAARGPQANAAVVTLEPLRGESTPARRLSVPSGSGPVVLLVELGDGEGHGAAPRYEAVLSDASGELWRTSELIPDHQGAVAISLPASFLEPGDHELLLRALESAAPPLSFKLRVTR